MATLYADPINGTKITSRLADAITDKLTVNHIESQVDAGGATIIVRNAQGSALGEVFVEMSHGNLVCHVWDKQGGSPIWTGILANRVEIRES